MLHPFSYVSARSKEEALSLLASLPEAALIAGGTDMVVRMRRGETHSHLIDVAGVPEIAGIKAQAGRLRIGAGATHALIAADAAVRKLCAGLAIACSQVGSPQIRHMGTLGGNLANASPAADSLAPLLVHSAEATLESAAAVRRETIEALITAPYKTTLCKNELISSISVDALEGYEEGYRRVAKRAAWAISRLSCAWAIREEDGVIADARIAVGSCTPVPFRPHQAEDFLKGRRREASVVAQAVEMVMEQIRQLAGMRPSFVYKLPTVRDLLTSALGGLSCS
jgi:CO/xanthine dehydrogenase FAD-binding subunit